LGNGAYAASCLFFAHVVWVFRFDRPFPRGLYGIIPVVLLSFWLTFDESFAIRAQVFSLWAILGSLFTGFLLIWRVEQPFRLANGVTSLPFLVVGLASMVRLVVNLGSTPSSETYYNQTGVNVWYMLGSILISTVTLFGYFMMTGIRTEQILYRKDDEIEARNRKLLASGRAKDLFFSIIAHDLRGPIGGAARYARKHLFGRMTGLEAKYNEVETLASALEKTNEFLEKLLWWSRAQLQDWVPLQKPIDLQQIFSQAMELVRSAADLKEISLHADPDVKLSPIADPESVQLILVNLLSNAVKFSLPGKKVRITVSEESSLCLVTIEDEGVGMDPLTLDRLFRIEDKLTTHGTSGERGSGLGLILSQSLAERNFGGITIESQPGVGTRATLWLPTKIPG
jgi:signal transduction histidine kinase